MDQLVFSFIMQHPVASLVALYIVSNTIVLPFQFYFQYKAFKLSLDTPKRKNATRPTSSDHPSV